MKAFLIFISFITACFPTGEKLSPGPSFPFSFNEEGLANYKLLMQFGENSITGLCILKAGEDVWKGSIINEFGIKAFDLTYQTKKQKVKLINVTSFMNKWYIKKIIRDDWKYLLSYPEYKEKHKHRQLTIGNDGTITLENKKYKIKYIFTTLFN